MTDQQAERSSRTARSGNSVVYFVFACLGVLPVLVMPIFQFLSVGGNAEYACIAGPVPSGVVIQGATSLVEGYKTAFPAGRYCEWESLAGGALSYQTGWLTTVLALLGTALVVWMTVHAIRERRPRTLAAALIPVAVALLSWVAVFV